MKFMASQIPVKQFVFSISNSKFPSELSYAKSILSNGPQNDLANLVNEKPNNIMKISGPGGI